MKNFLILTFLIFLSYIIGAVISNKKKIKEYDLFDNNHTNALKGFSILTVVWAHKGVGFGVPGLQFVAGIGVSLFLVCSGYGMMNSYKKNQLKDFWKKRLVRVFIPWLIAEMVLFLLNGSFTWNSLKDYYSYQNMNWYIKYIFAMYLLFWAGCIVYQKMRLSDNKLIIAVVLVAMIGFIVDSVWLKKPEIPFLHARQMMSFPLGIILYLKKRDLEEFVNQKINFRMIIYALLLLFIGMGMQLFLQKPFWNNMNVIATNLTYLITDISLTISILMFSVYTRKLFANYYFYATGTISFEIFLVHLYKCELIERTKSVVLFFAVMYILAIILYVIDNKIKTLCLKNTWRK